MEIIYQPGAFSEALIFAPAQEWAVISRAVIDLARAGVGEVEFPAAIPPSPDGQPLVFLKDRSEAGNCCVTVEDSRVLVAAEPNLPVGYHTHFEHAGREWHVAPGSIPLVMITVLYDGVDVGHYDADLLVEKQVLVELKVCKAFDDIHLAQCLNYLRATGLRLCLLLNFGTPRLGIKRVAGA